jgi:tetratricopeptide (TPR) repeat protein
MKLFLRITLIILLILAFLVACATTEQKKGNDYRNWCKFWSLRVKGHPDESITHYNKAIELDPRDSLAYRCRGAAYLEKGQYDKAISDQNKAIELNPGDAWAYNLRGVAYLEKGQYDKAISDYNKAIKISPWNYIPNINRGIAYFEKGQYDKAISDYNKAIKLNRWVALTYIRRGIAYDRKGQYNKAILDYNKAIEVNSNDPSAYNGKAWMLSTCPDARYRNGIKAIELAKKALELETRATFVDTLAAAYAEAGNFEDAIITQKKAINMLKRKSVTKIEIDDYIERLNFYKSGKPWREIQRK